MSFRYGDIVALILRTSTQGNTTVSHGRLHGKIDVNSLAYVRGIITPTFDVDMYVFRPHPDSYDDDEFLYAIQMFGFNGAVENLEMEWGECPDDRWIPAQRDELKSLLVPSTIRIRKELGLCPRCAHEGEWFNLSLVCPWHGVFL